MSGESLLQISGVSFSYGIGTRALEDVSFEVGEGEICALLGPNGSGKTTLLKLICALQTYTNGTILLKGREVRQWGVSELARTITYVPSELHSEFPITVREVVALGRDAHSQSRSGLGFSQDDQDVCAVETALKQCGCLDLSDRFIQELSHGQRQLVAMARAIAQGTKIIAVDETFSKMDLHHQVEMGKLLESLTHEGKTILWVVHDFNLALSRAHTCLLLRKGKKIAFGNVSDALTVERLKLLYPSLKFSFTQSPIDQKRQMFFGADAP